MPPSERWRRLANRSDSSFIAKAEISRCKVCQRSNRRPQVHRLNRGYGSHPDDTTTDPATVALLRAAISGLDD